MTIGLTRYSGRLAAIAATGALTAAIFVLPAKADTDLPLKNDALGDSLATPRAVDFLFHEPGPR